MWECALSLLGPAGRQDAGRGGYHSGAPGERGGISRDPLCLSWEGTCLNDECVRGLEGRLPPSRHNLGPSCRAEGALSTLWPWGRGHGAERWQTPTQAAAGCWVDLEENADSLSSIFAPWSRGIELLNFTGDGRRQSLVLECAGGFKSPCHCASVTHLGSDAVAPKSGPRLRDCQEARAEGWQGPPAALHRAWRKGGVPVKARGRTG